MRPFCHVFLLAFLAACAPAPEVTFDAGAVRIAVDATGSVVHVSSEDGRDFVAPGVSAPLLSIRENGVIHAPAQAAWVDEDSVLALTYREGLEARVHIRQRATHASLEVVSISDTARVELVIWGPYPMILGEVIGETVGVVQGDGLAIGLQALNPRTLGGYPWNENDAMPQLDIFESGDYSDLSEEGKRHVLYRVEAAKPDSFGSTLQAYARNRSRPRTIPNWGFEEYHAPAFHDGGVVGSRIALFGSPADEALATIGAIELAEGLPHPMLDGVWAKQSPRASQAYVIMPFGQETAGAAMDVVERAGMQYLYHPNLFASWGHFTLRADDFPDGVEGLRTVVEQAEERGLRVGGHTLSNFIQTHDPYVSPDPDPRLARVGVGHLTAGVNPSATELQVLNPDLFRAGERSTLRAAVLGHEIIQYGSVSDGSLNDVQRGAFGTRAAAHEAGAEIALLADHGYRTLLTDPDLSIEMARNLADVFNRTGLRHISFDGLEGNRSTGMGNYGEILFAQAWFDGLTDQAQQDLIVTASRTSHYFWHLYTRMNWGEPWYAGFRESQTEYRMKNQAYFRRNLMPGMLGWFSLRPETSVEDIEWMLARSAAYDAGYAFYTSLEVLRENGKADDILDLLARWERARLSGAFTTDQRARMEDVSGEFHLEGGPEEDWTLYPVAVIRHDYTPRERQPGEPPYDSIDLENEGMAQPLAFSVKAVGSGLTGVAFSLNGVGEHSVPGRLREGEILKYSGGPEAIVYSSSWHRIRTVPVDASTLTMSPGAHRLHFRARFEEPGEGAAAKIEVRVTGPGEPVGPDAS